MIGPEWEKVGEFGVDSGLCWIGDPCYNEISIPKSFFDTPGPKVYPDGICTSTAYGDGSYPVYVKYRGNRVMQVLIDFTQEEEGQN